MERQPSWETESRISLTARELALIVESLDYARDQLKDLKALSETYPPENTDTLDALLLEDMGVRIAIMEELVSNLKPLLAGEEP